MKLHEERRPLAQQLGSLSLGQAPSTSQAAHLPPIPVPADQHHAHMQQHQSHMQSNVSVASLMPGSVQNLFSQTQNFSNVTSQVQQGFLNQNPSAMNFPTSVMNQMPPSQIPAAPAFKYPYPPPGQPGQPGNPSPTNNSMCTLNSLGGASFGLDLDSFRR